MFRQSTLVRRLGATITATSAMLIVASTRAAALVEPVDPASGQSRVPTAPATDSASSPLLWIALTAAIVAALIVVAVSVRVHRRRMSRQSAATPVPA